jgi:alpha-tubulin suppressor-like RCC1 family protein
MLASKLLKTITTFPKASLYMWGNNIDGEIGDSSLINKSSPVSVISGSSWSKISVGFSHTLGIKTDKTLWGWDQMDMGNLVYHQILIM